jgi:hypothetical protein
MLLGLLQAPTNVRGAWVVDEQDRCVNEWRVSDLLRGPIAITNSPFLPLRSVAGGLLFVWDVETSDGRIWKVPLYGTTLLSNIRTPDIGAEKAA